MLRRAALAAFANMRAPFVRRERKIASNLTSRMKMNRIESSHLSTSSEPSSLTEFGNVVLTTPCGAKKSKLTQAAMERFKVGSIIIGNHAPPDEPSRPNKPDIVKSALPSAKKLHVSNAVYCLHSLAHVELNAIDLAWDTMLRFRKMMNMEWYADWLKIANDESRHFLWLEKQLKDLGSFYGQLPAHSIIWDGARVTKDNVAERLVIGNLVQEARGLDAGPRLVEKLVGMGYSECASVVRKIAEEEKDHVRIGMKWFLRECEKLDGDKSPKERFWDIALVKSNRGAFSPPFNVERRREVGLEPSWYLPVAEMMKELLQEEKRQSACNKGVESAT